MEQFHGINEDTVSAVPTSYSPFMRFERDISNEDYAYHNVASCPDCSGGMIRQGRCCVCPSCGFESCHI
ncbi:MAG: hypothetical protein GY867_08155 [bacterium]|nr:hypothetical protein [bacterium]